MKIILSPSKEMKFINPQKGSFEIREESQLIIKELEKLTKEDLLRIYKINSNKADEVKDYIKGFSKDICYLAKDLYSGLAYRSLNISNLDYKAIEYLENHLVILSALYGPIKINQLIKGYRLDFQTSLKVEGKSLAELWKTTFNKYFAEKETIVNLASDEFSSLLNREDYNWYDFQFFESKNGKLVKHSTISKKARGLMTRFMAENKIEDMEKIKLFDYKGYRYSDSLSSDKTLTFVRIVN